MSAFAPTTSISLKSALPGHKRDEIRPCNATLRDRMTRRSTNCSKRSRGLIGSAETRSKIVSSTTHWRVAPNRRNLTERCR